MARARKEIQPKRENYEDLDFRGWDGDMPRHWLGEFVAFLRGHDRKTIVGALTCISMIVACAKVSNPVALATVVVTEAVFGLMISRRG